MTPTNVTFGIPKESNFREEQEQCFLRTNS